MEEVVLIVWITASAFHNFPEHLLENSAMTNREAIHWMAIRESFLEKEHMRQDGVSNEWRNGVCVNEQKIV